jgi:hypothetical protein
MLDLLMGQRTVLYWRRNVGRNAYGLMSSRKRKVNISSCFISFSSAYAAALSSILEALFRYLIITGMD